MLSLHALVHSRFDLKRRFSARRYGRSTYDRLGRSTTLDGSDRWCTEDNQRRGAGVFDLERVGDDFVQWHLPEVERFLGNSDPRPIRRCSGCLIACARTPAGDQEYRKNAYQPGQR